MVVGDAAAEGHGEITAVAGGMGGTPHAFDHLRGIAHRHALLMELRRLAAHHVEQDAKFHLLALGVVVARPILGTERP